MSGSLTQAVLVFCGLFIFFFVISLVVLIAIGVTPDALSVPVFMLVSAMASGAVLLPMYAE